MRIALTVVQTSLSGVTSRGVPTFMNIAVVLVVAAGCGDSASLPISAPTAPPPPTTVSGTLFGTVYDTVARSVGGATVDVVDGPAAGQKSTTDERGHFSITGTYAIGAMTLRVSGEGYETTTINVIVPPNPSPTFTFTLYVRPLAAAIDLAGAYTLTFKADAACSSILPPEVRTRSYTATIAPLSAVVDGYGVTLTESSLLSRDPLLLRVSGDYAYMPVDPEFGGGVTERLPDGEDAYVQLTGAASGTASRTGSWSIPFNGQFDYCQVAPTALSVYLCGLTNPTRRSCASTQHQLVFSRR